MIKKMRIDMPNEMRIDMPKDKVTKERNHSSLKQLRFSMLLALLVLCQILAGSIFADGATPVVVTEVPLGSEVPISAEVPVGTEVPLGTEIANSQHEVYKAKVTQVDQVAIEEDEFIQSMYLVEVVFTQGPNKGTSVVIEHAIAKTDSFVMLLEVGDKVLVSSYNDADGKLAYYVEDYQRVGSIYLLLAIFVLVILWVGKGHGIKAIGTLVFTLLVVWFVHIPLLLKGFPPLLTTVLVSVIATGFTILILSGWSKKSFSAIAGTIAGVMVAALLAYWIGSSAHLTGLSNEEAVMLKFIPQGDIFKARELLYAGILLGTLGAGMDVAMSISSAISEIHFHSPNLSRRKLFKSGMNIGRDVMGTMVDTLILAYLGSSLPLIILFVANDMPILQVMNLDIIATEIVRSLTSSVGIVASLPLTAAIAVFLHKPQKEKPYKEQATETLEGN